MNKIFIVIYVIVILMFAGCVHNGGKLNYPIGVKPKNVGRRAIIVSNLLFTIKANSNRMFYYKFAPGDTIIISAWAIKGNNISNLNVTRWPDTDVFNMSAVKSIFNERILNKRESVYRFTISNSSLFSSKIYKIMIYRIPSAESLKDFNINVYWDTSYDTTYVNQRESILVGEDTTIEKVIDSKIAIPPDGKSYITVDLPENTLFYGYWLGAFTGDNDWKNNNHLNTMLQSFVAGKSRSVKIRRKDAVIDYYFIRGHSDLRKYLNGYRFSCFKKVSGVISDYGRSHEYPERYFYVAFKNDEGRDITVRFKLFAMVVTPEYRYDYITVPKVKIKLIPRLYETE